MPTSLPNIPETSIDYTLVSEPSGVERIIVKADGYDVSGESTITIPDQFKKNTITALSGYDFDRKQRVYGLQFSRNINKFCSIDTGIIGKTVFAGISFSF